MTKYMIKVHVGNDGEGKTLIKPQKPGDEVEPLLFDNAVDATLRAQKLRMESSIGIWCSVEVYEG